MEDHDPAADIETLEHTPGEEHAPRAAKPSISVFSLGLLVEEHGGLDLKILGAEERVLWRQPAQLGERGNALVIAVLHHEPTWREGKEEHPEEQDPGRDELESERNTPRDGLLSQARVTMSEVTEEVSIRIQSAVGDVGWVAMGAAGEVHSVVEPEGDGRPDGDGELLQRDKRATELRGSDLGLVQRDNHGEHANADTTNDSASEQHSRVQSAGLKARS